MAESWFALSRQDQAEALEVAADRTGRPAHLLEKDIWVVWALAALLLLARHILLGALKSKIPISSNKLISWRARPG
jgi:hypothetical protein